MDASFVNKAIGKRVVFSNPNDLIISIAFNHDFVVFALEVEF